MQQWIKAAVVLLAMAIGGAAQAAEPVNLNRADAAALMTHLEGIGEAKARAIVAWRESNGPFERIDDLVLVKGIGEKLLARNRDRLSLDSGITRLQGSAVLSSARHAVTG